MPSVVIRRPARSPWPKVEPGPDVPGFSPAAAEPVAQPLLWITFAGKKALSDDETTSPGHRQQPSRYAERRGP